MTFATATLERFTETTAALTPITETPVFRNPTAEEARRTNSPFDMMLYVTRIDTGDERYGDVVRTVQTVAASPSRDGWFRRTESGSLQRLYGAPLNPPMVNGHYYRQLGNRGMLVQFHDEAHRGDRHAGLLALNIIAANGTPWPFPNDSQGMWDESVPYIEVEGPATPAVVPAAEELTDVRQFTAAAGELDPTFGFGRAEADGTVLLNPELEVGEMYVFWTSGRARDNGSMSEVRTVTALPEGSDPVFNHVGYWSLERVDGEQKPYFYTARRTVLDHEPEKAWVKLALKDPEVDEEDSARRLTVYAAQRTSEASDFAEFNEATNELAKDNDWCSEYEDIVTKLGMEGRTKTVHDFDVEVGTSISFEADSVSSRIDSLVADDYNIPGISLNSARLRGDVTVTIRVSDVADEDDASDQIDSDMVYEHLSNMMSGFDDLEIDSWSVSGTRQVND